MRAAADSATGCGGGGAATSGGGLRVGTNVACGWRGGGRWAASCAISSSQVGADAAGAGAGAAAALVVVGARRGTVAGMPGTRLAGTTDPAADTDGTSTL